MVYTKTVERDLAVRVVEPRPVDGRERARPVAEVHLLAVVGDPGEGDLYGDFTMMSPTMISESYKGFLKIRVCFEMLVAGYTI